LQEGLRLVGEARDTFAEPAAHVPQEVVSQR
jgi:hypothetical protein